jgi:hypothetical protein
LAVVAVVVLKITTAVQVAQELLLLVMLAQQSKHQAVIQSLLAVDM